MTWMQRLNGGSFDLLAPRAEDVDFREIAWALAHLNRYCGHAPRPVSVALHTLIAMCCGDIGDRPWLLLHDAHEAYTGDVTTPVKNALNATPLTAAPILDLQRRCAAAILAAAGLPPMTAETAARVKRADLRALATERRDFLAPPLRRWAREVEQAEPFGDMRILRPLYAAAARGPAHVADLLTREFETHLPALKRAA